MSASYSPPPAYEDVNKKSTKKGSNSKRQTWYSKLMTLEFNQDEATEYAKLFVTNEVEMNMIPELNDDLLESIGIEKAGHRIRILRLQRKSPPSTPVATRPVLDVKIPRCSRHPNVANVKIPRCSWHPNVAANEKCHKCDRLVCLNCRRVRSSNNGHGHGHVHYYCQDCYDECTIL
ncbi:unnamed protein product [Adineta steineri]|uniref:SAM domain-containing protein n=1 Tax=Adineta steineri TaxID=433720 RepID=A0A816AD78_9BILA|nr:unnamed protein product [Adineta steineri]CAF1595322.1 unnamed protein product [Adineta steineri]